MFLTIIFKNLKIINMENYLGENMYKLSRIGATIIPAMPGFYNHPQTIDDLVDFMVGKILNYLNIDNNLFNKWEDTEYET